MKLFLVIIGTILIYASFVTSVGFALYLMANGTLTGVALWSGFKLWASMFFGGWFCAGTSVVFQ